MGVASSMLTGVSPYDVKGLGTDRLRTGGLCPPDLVSRSRPLELLLGVEGGVFLGIRLRLPLVPLGLVGDPFCVDSSTPESASASAIEDHFSSIR